MRRRHHPGAASGNGGCSSPAIDALINATQPPVIWQPEITHQLAEVGPGLKG